MLIYMYAKCQLRIFSSLGATAIKNLQNTSLWRTRVRGSGPNFRKLEGNSGISELPLTGLFATYRRDYAI